MVDVLGRLGLLSEGNVIICPDPPICHFCGFINGSVWGKSRGIGGTGRVVVFLGIRIG